MCTPPDTMRRIIDRTAVCFLAPNEKQRRIRKRNTSFGQALKETTMRRDAGWFSGALAMAFLALVSLFVSPAFAWNCCCDFGGASKAHCLASSGLHPKSAAQPTPSCCERELAPAKLPASTSSRHFSLCKARIQTKCACLHPESPVFVSFRGASHASFFLLALGLPVRAAMFPLAENARFIPLFCLTARPRSPGWGAVRGRAPPVG